MDKSICDVVIVGMGPAGLECARTLQDSDFNVVLLEKNTIVGPKPCGGGVTSAEKIVDIPDELCRIFTKETFLIGNSRAQGGLKNYRKIFDRYELGQYQLKKIKSDNVKIITGVNVKEIQTKKVVTNIGDFYFDYLVGADGSNSIVRKHLGLPVKFSQGIYYEIPGNFSELVSYSNPKDISSGYIWEFPHITHNNVGIYFDPVYLSSAKAKKYLDEYITGRGYSLSTSKLFAHIINYDYEGHHFGNIFLIGDAGGFTSRLHGGGINNAMISGRDVAKKILDPNYDEVGIQKILKDKKFEDRLLNIFYKNKWLQTPALKMLYYMARMKWL